MNRGGVTYPTPRRLFAFMSDALERLKWLCSPDAERLSDGERINQFVKAGLEAVGELDALLTAAKTLLAHQCDPAVFNSKGEFLDPDLQTLYRTIKHEKGHHALL
jgi:hypothetical protein